jgi:hypothetical protein
MLAKLQSICNLRALGQEAPNLSPIRGRLAGFGAPPPRSGAAFARVVGQMEGDRSPGGGGWASLRARRRLHVPSSDALPPLVRGMKPGSNGTARRLGKTSYTATTWVSIKAPSSTLGL